jgi:hypothetical protein
MDGIRQCRSSLLFAFSMTIAYGVKAPLDDSVFAAFAAALLLATIAQH